MSNSPGQFEPLPPDISVCLSCKELEQELAQARADLATFNAIAVDKDGTPFSAASAWRAECNRLQDSITASQAECQRLREALEEYGEHDQDCILAQCRQGRPADDGGYERQYGYGSREKWYRSPERPICECGLDSALSSEPKLEGEKK